MQNSNWTKGVLVGIASFGVATAADAESRFVVDGHQQKARARLDFKIVIPMVARLALGPENAFGTGWQSARGTNRKLTQQIGGAFAHPATNAGDVSFSVTHQPASDHPSDRVAEYRRQLQQRVTYTMSLP